jgi:hypothetical protein
LAVDLRFRPNLPLTGSVAQQRDAAQVFGVPHGQATAKWWPELGVDVGLQSARAESACQDSTVRVSVEYEWALLHRVRVAVMAELMRVDRRVPACKAAGGWVDCSDFVGSIGARITKGEGEVVPDPQGCAGASRRPLRSQRLPNDGQRIVPNRQEGLRRFRDFDRNRLAPP